MTPTELEAAIQEILTNEYDYIAKFKLVEVEFGFDAILDLNTPLTPLHIAAQLPAEKFLKYFKEEMSLRRLHHVQYYTGYRNEE